MIYVSGVIMFPRDLVHFNSRKYRSFSSGNELRWT